MSSSRFLLESGLMQYFRLTVNPNAYFTTGNRRYCFAQLNNSIVLICIVFKRNCSNVQKISYVYEFLSVYYLIMRSQHSIQMVQSAQKLHKGREICTAQKVEGED